MMKQKIVHIIATCGFVGYLYAPGTAASIVTTVCMFFVPTITLPYYVVGVALLSIFAVCVSHSAEKVMGQPDPSIIVIDEVVGMMIALTCVPKTVISYIFVCALFRIFDIAKPFPVSWAERRLSGGLAIVMDDVIAGMIVLCCYWLTRLCFLKILLRPF